MILGTWLVLLPPLLVLLAVVKTKNLELSLLFGIVLASLLATNFSFFESGKLLVGHTYEQLVDFDAFFIYLFLISIGIVVSLISYTGGAAAFARVVSKHLHNRRMAEMSSIALSAILVVEDYLSNLTTGYVMRPLTDQFKIPRTKLAFLVHSLAGPAVILAPISSWAAYITGQLNIAGIGSLHEEGSKIIAEPFTAYLYSIPFILYSFAIISSVLFIVWQRISFGPMQKHEEIAQETGNLFGGKESPQLQLKHPPRTEGSLQDLLVPLGVLLGISLIGIPFATEQFSASFILGMAGIASIVIGSISALLRKTLTLGQLRAAFLDGIRLMASPVLIAFLASILSILLRSNLFVGQYLATTLLGNIDVLLLPGGIFIVSLVITLMTGSTWGTIALMLPIAIPMLTTILHLPESTPLSEVPLLLPILGAIFSAGTYGDHISPVSETTIMASTSAGCHPVDHTYTQILYTIPAILATTIGFFISGFLTSYPPLVSGLILIVLVIIISCSLLYIMNKVAHFLRKTG